MVPDDSTLVLLVRLIDRIPMPATTPRRGRPPVYPDRLFLKALVIMIIKRLPRVYLLLTVLDQDPAEMHRLRALLTDAQGRYPTRRTWERRLRAVPDRLPAQIGCLGRHLVATVEPWATCGRAAAIDSTPLRALGGVWHKKHREAGEVPHTSIDTDAHWTKSGWHGWVYGWKLHLVTTVAGVWIPLAARLTPANVADNEEALRLLPELPLDLHYLLGDTHYQDPKLHAAGATRGWDLVATRHGRYPHTDGGVEVRRVFHKLRSTAIENLNGQFKGIFECGGQVPTRGAIATQRYVLGAVFVYQLTLLHRFQTGGDLRVGLKAFLRAA
jgi:hypothetical protein